MPLLFVASKIFCAIFFFSKLPGEIEQNNWKGRGGGCVSSNWELHIICAEKISPVLLTVITHSVCKYVSSFLWRSEVSGLLSLFPATKLCRWCNCSNMQTPKWRPNHVTVSSHLLCDCAVKFESRQGCSLTLLNERF